MADLYDLHTLHRGRQIHTGWAMQRQVFKYNHERDHSRIGGGPWKPQDGDLCVCDGIGGDGFHSFIAIRPDEDGVYHEVGGFGAYKFGELMKTDKPCTPLQVTTQLR